MKETISISGRHVKRRIRDLDFMILCDGKEYAHVTHQGSELVVSRPRGSQRVWKVVAA